MARTEPRTSSVSQEPLKMPRGRPKQRDRGIVMLRGFTPRPPARHRTTLSSGR
jgi:hypothetical protein